MIHKRLQRNIIGEDGLRSLSTNTTICTRSVCGGGVQLGQEETRLRATGITHNEAW